MSKYFYRIFTFWQPCSSGLGMTLEASDFSIRPKIGRTLGSGAHYRTLRFTYCAHYRARAISKTYSTTFVDVRVFNPNAPSNRNTTIEKCYRKHEMEKKRAYAQRVREIEHSSFTPIVLSASGGFAREATNFYKRLASRLADKWDQPYSLTMSWLRCTISFALLRSAIQCIRGARSSGGHPAVLPVDLVIAEAHLN